MHPTGPADARGTGGTGSGAGGQASPLLRIRDLTVAFDAAKALDQVSLDIQAGELVALAGENGAGKSILVRCVAGDLAPSTGEILLDGTRVGCELRAARRAGIAVVWQRSELCDNLDVAANLMLGVESNRMMISESLLYATARRELAWLGIDAPEPTAVVGTLSGGQRQLVAVARAMLGRPRLLVLDEPTASLGISEAALVERLILRLNQSGTTIMLVSHDVEQMLRVAGRVVVLHKGRIAGSVRPPDAHAEEVVAMMAGQPVESSARRQLGRLGALVDQLAGGSGAGNLPVILSALSTAVGAHLVCLHLVDAQSLVLAGQLGLSARQAALLTELPLGQGGGPIGQAAATESVVVSTHLGETITAGPGSWDAELVGTLESGPAGSAVSACWSVPVLSGAGVSAVITLFRAVAGRPQQDELDLITLYAGYAAGAIEHERLLRELTSRNEVLETIREVLVNLADPVSLTEGLRASLQALRRGLGADEVLLLAAADGDLPAPADLSGTRSLDGNRWRVTYVGRERSIGPGLDEGAAAWLATAPKTSDPVVALDGANDHCLITEVHAPGGPFALAARWEQGGDTGTPAPIAAVIDASALIADAAHSIRLALEREESERARQKSAALRRSQDLQRAFLSRLSHELRTPLTAIRGYASSLIQPDVTWDDESQRRFVSRIGAESTRLGRLVDDLLDFSAIESDVLRLQPDWCEIELVMSAARDCLSADVRERVTLDCRPGLVVFADHDRLEQVLLNLMTNALQHNPAGTSVRVSARCPGDRTVQIAVSDDGTGLPADVAAAPFDFPGRRVSRMSGSGLGLSICKGIVDAHGGSLAVRTGPTGTTFTVTLSVDPDATLGEEH